ncbi:MAG: hypothetical protein QXF12_06010 [Candidatus Aenigmatarchaeota archaeon]
MINFIKRLFYRLCIVSTKLIVKDENILANAEVITKIFITTSKGEVFIEVKKDRRQKSRLFKTFILEFIFPDEITLKRRLIRTHMFLVTKIIFFKKIDYDVLVPILVDMYMDSLIKKANENTHPL